MTDTMQNWAIGLAVTLAAPFVIKYAIKQVQQAPQKAIDWLKAYVAHLLQSGKINPCGYSLFMHIFKAIAEWAEEQIPDSGMGEARMNLVLDTLATYPFIGLLVKHDRNGIKQLIEAGVKAMDEALKKEIKDNPNG